MDTTIDINERRFPRINTAFKKFKVDRAGRAQVLELLAKVVPRQEWRRFDKTFLQQSAGPVKAHNALASIQRSLGSLQDQLAHGLASDLSEPSPWSVRIRIANSIGLEKFDNMKDIRNRQEITSKLRMSKHRQLHKVRAVKFKTVNGSQDYGTLKLYVPTHQDQLDLAAQYPLIEAALGLDKHCCMLPETYLVQVENSGLQHSIYTKDRMRKKYLRAWSKMNKVEFIHGSWTAGHLILGLRSLKEAVMACRNPVYLSGSMGFLV